MPLLRLVLRVLIIAVIYIIIFWALRIMYKDIKGQNKKKNSIKRLGLEVIQIGQGNSILKVGSVVPISTRLTIGRKEDNELILDDQYVSGHHAVISLKNNDYVIQDLKSTNGVIVNGNILEKPLYLNIDDEIAIGEYIFKVIG